MPGSSLVWWCGIPHVLSGRTRSAPVGGPCPTLLMSICDKGLPILPMQLEWGEEWRSEVPCNRHSAGPSVNIIWYIPCRNIPTYWLLFSSFKWGTRTQKSMLVHQLVHINCCNKETLKMTKAYFPTIACLMSVASHLLSTCLFMDLGFFTLELVFHHSSVLSSSLPPDKIDLRFGENRSFKWEWTAWIVVHSHESCKFHRILHKTRRPVETEELIEVSKLSNMRSCV